MNDVPLPIAATIRGLMRGVIWISLVNIALADTAYCQQAAATTDAAKLKSAELKSTQGEIQALKVMTWNVEWFFDENQGDNFSQLAKEKSAPSRADWDWHRDAIAASLAKSKPTILALQEVENRRVMWYLTRALDRTHQLQYTALCDESTDHFTEQDVALMFCDPVDVLQTSHYRLTKAMKNTKRYYDLTKHIVGVFVVPNGTDTPEIVTLMNLHMRSRAEGESLRKRQASLAHHWMRDAIQSGANVIVLGDTNTEETSDTTKPHTDLGILCGLETESTNDDLVDLTLRLKGEARRTHLLPGRQFDRILVSRSLVDDDPTRPDLVFSSIEVMRDLAVRGDLDSQQDHWERYWQTDQDQRDLSDHLPVQATFEIR